MSSSNFESTIDLVPRSSLRAVQILFVLHAGLILLLMLAMEPGRWMALIAVLFALSWFSLRRHPVFGYGPRSLARLTWHAREEPDRGWTLQDASGSFDAELLGSSTVHSLLIVLNFKLKSGGYRTRALLGDELETEQLRRLRARLAVFK